MRRCLAALIVYSVTVAATPAAAQGLQPWCTTELNGVSHCVYASLDDCRRRTSPFVECLPNPSGEID